MKSILLTTPPTSCLIDGWLIGCLDGWLVFRTMITVLNPRITFLWRKPKHDIYQENILNQYKTKKTAMNVEPRFRPPSLLIPYIWP